MRPPSYYNSIVRSNNSISSGLSYSASDYDSPAASTLRTSSQQLRSSFSSPPSSSYVSRSHLPFVPQSTLVAHCFTGVGSSTRPYGNTGSTATGTTPSYRGGGGGSGGSSYVSASLSGGGPHYSSGSSSRPPTVSRRANYSLTSPSSSRSASSYLSSPSSSLSSSSTTTTTTTMATSRYRPTTTSSLYTSPYYKPIRLRERPLLTQISRHIKSPTPPVPSPTPPPQAVSAAAPAAAFIHSTTDEARARQQEEQTDDWSRDIGRNISRNKYLIKFREIDKQPGAKSVGFEPATDEAATVMQVTVDVSLVEEHKPEIPAASGDAKTEPTTNTRLDSTCDDDDDDNNNNNKTVASTARKRDKKVLAETRDESGPAEGNKKASPVKREKKNVKLRLRQVGAATANSTEVGATTTTTIINNKKPSEAITATATDSKPPAESQEKPVRAKRPAKSKEEKENLLVAAETPPTTTSATTTTTSEPVKLRKESPKTKLSSKGSDSTVTSGQTAATVTPKVKTKKKARKALEEQAGAASKQEEPPITSVTVSLPKLSIDQQQQQQQQQQQDAAGQVAKAGSGSASPRKAPGRIRFREYHHDDFNFLTVLGHGGWGFVILAELKEHDACFAVKCIKKITIVEDDDYDSIMIERKVLALGNIHPFICKLFCTFETAGYLFFVMEYCAGGDLMFHVQHEGKFSESRCRFYAAEIICAIRFLHNRHIIYRDLKLDNILLDSRGHIRLVDFGMCQCRTYREEMLPSNFCGTPEYISPEIIKGVPYNHSVDWWSFGVLLYEMAVGKMPFRGNDENELLWNVCYEQIHYPMFLSKELTSLLKLLLEREPTLRMGMATCKAGDIYDQPYFRGVDWRAVEEMRVEPPFIPEVKSNRDVSNFDSDFTESTCELSPVDEGTLAKIDQRQFQQFPYTNPEISIFDSRQRAPPT